MLGTGLGQEATPEGAPQPSRLSTAFPCSTTCFLSTPAPEAGPPGPFPHGLGGSPRNTRQKRSPQRKVPSSPSPGAPLLALVLTEHFTPAARPDSDLHVTPYKLLTEAAPAQACARMGLVSMRKGTPGATVALGGVHVYT